MKRTNRIARFDGGAKRTDRKPRFDLIPFEFLESVAEVLTEGAVRYGPYNWKRGKKDFFVDAWNHAFVHLQKFKEGDRSEDHLAHLACNVAFMIRAVRNGVLSQEDFRTTRGPSLEGIEAGHGCL
jgi:dATP/dGTP diphosphohydrolase